MAWLSEFLPDFNSRGVVKGSGPFKVRLHALWGTPAHLPRLYFNPSCWNSRSFHFSLEAPQEPIWSLEFPEENGRPFPILAVFKSPTSLFSAHFQFNILKPPVCFATSTTKGHAGSRGYRSHRKIFILFSDWMHRLEEKSHEGSSLHPHLYLAMTTVQILNT